MLCNICCKHLITFLKFESVNSKAHLAPVVSEKKPCVAAISRIVWVPGKHKLTDTRYPEMRNSSAARTQELEALGEKTNDSVLRSSAWKCFHNCPLRVVIMAFRLA